VAFSFEYFDRLSQRVSKEATMADKIEVNPVFEKVLEEVSTWLAFPRSVARTAQTCVMCGGQAESFKNAISEKEYTLSGMCQTCQDNFFDNDDDLQP
jgi:uncharacterized CHY-type Zn-finger protein